MTGGAAEIDVEVVDVPQALAELRAEWDYLFLKDPDANAFLSFPWIQETCKENPYRWSTLTARHKHQRTLLGILPLKLRVHWSRSRQRFETEMEAGGRLSNSLYSGIICDPAAEDAVLEAMVSRLAALPWTKLSLLYFAPDHRAKKLGSLLDAASLEVKWKRYTSGKNRIDRLLAASIPLPVSLDGLATLCTDEAQLARYRDWRQGHGPDFRPRVIDSAGWAEFRPRLGDFLDTTCREDDASKVRRYMQTAEVAARANRLFLPVIEQDGRLLSIAAHVCDPTLGDMVRLASATRQGDDGQIAARYLTLFALECAIEQGLLNYDFGREAHDASLGFAFETSQSRYLTVQRPDLSDDACLDILNIGQAVERTASFIENGKSREALAGCRQIQSLFQ